ncbi:MAG TPA: ABC transporter substrate-binding protein [Solirubrobacteraceae bacterium]|nr:ABC transporter substrate-binding protein [Solirubrobacteraceae bacterium]
MAAGFAAALTVAIAAAPASSATKPVVFNVGDTQGIDSMNPIVGVTVPAYEAWNIQYATLTDKSAKDFSTTPGLAQSWTGSEDGRTWTYKLRPNMKWSDGQPLTSEDVAYTINRARKEEWLNYTSVVANLKATAPDPTTVIIHSSVSDPKLPTVDSYIVPKHIFEKYDAKAVTKYPALDGVGSGPFVLEQFEKGQFARFKANPNYYGGKPAVDRVVLRVFDNPDAMVAALKRGEIDAAEDIPGTAFHQLQKDPNLETVQGNQGAMSEFAINGGDGLKKPHPALLDIRVRQAIAHAIDKETIVKRALAGLGTPTDTLSVSPDTSWSPKIPDGQRYDFDLDKARQILDQAGYKDTNGDGIREMPGGGRPLKFRYAVRTEGDTGPPTAELISGWLRQIGIATTQKVYNDSQLTEVIGKGDYDLFVWGWTPFVDPDPMLSYFTCSQVSADPKDPTNYYNDANWCDKQYDALYSQQKVERDRAKRMDIVHQMLTRFYDAAVYDVLYTYPDLQAYRKNRFTGWIHQPEKTGPVIFSNTSPTYAKLKPVTAAATGGGDSGGGGGSGGVIAIVVIAVVVLGAGGYWLMRRRTADERE